MEINKGIRHTGKKDKEKHTFSKASVSAIAATGADWIITVALADILGMWYVTATAIGAVSAAVINFTVNFKWVFKDCGYRKAAVLFKYILVAILSIILNTGGTWILTETLTGEAYFILSKIITCIILALIWNYPMQKYVIYKNIPEK